MATEVEILGHKAKIVRVLGRTKLEPWQMEDQLLVCLKLDKAVGSIQSFPVPIPPKKYEREELLYNIRRRGEEELKRTLKEHSERNIEMAEMKERQKSLDALAAEAQSLVK